jgi:hypothetical protein
MPRYARRVKVSAILFSAFFVAGCGSSRSTPPAGPVAATPDEPPVGEIARVKELLHGDWAVAGEQVPVVWLHPHGGLSVMYGAAAATVPVIWVFDDVEGGLLEVYRYQGENVRNCQEKKDGGEGLLFSCEEGAGGVQFKRNGESLDIEEWTASSGPDTFHLLEGDGAPAPELEDADRQFAVDTAAKGADGWLPWFADDAMVWQGTTVLKDKAAREADIRETFEQIQLEWTPTVSRMLVPGALGVTSGTSVVTPKAGGEPHTGTYVTMWRKDPAGWRIILDTGRPDR